MISNIKPGSTVLRTFIFVFLVPALLACTTVARDKPFSVLEIYANHNVHGRVNNPYERVARLRKYHPAGSELQDLPINAIILYRVDVPKYLDALGYAGKYQVFEYGFAVLNVMYIVRKPRTVGFVVMQGLPGAGGISTQLADLAAMGVRNIIHVGICGLLDDGLQYGQLIVSNGSYRDGAAFLLDSDLRSQVSRPDTNLSHRLALAAARETIPTAESLGLTIPVYYFQPVDIFDSFRALPDAERPGFVEMEQASFFSVARHMGVQAASVVVGADRILRAGGRVVQEVWKGDLEELELAAFRVAVNALTME